VTLLFVSWPLVKIVAKVIAWLYLATDDKALTGPNHTVPVLEELVHGDMVFAVFPKLYTWKLTP
jgi:hypothetical protein